MTAPTPDPLNEADREVLAMGFAEGWGADLDDDEADFIRTDSDALETARHYADLIAPVVARMVAAAEQRGREAALREGRCPVCLSRNLAEPREGTTWRKCRGCEASWNSTANPQNPPEAAEDRRCGPGGSGAGACRSGPLGGAQGEERV